MSEQPGRYQRSSSGLVGAMLVLLLVIGGFLGLRALSRDNEATPVSTVDYAPVLKQARADHKLFVPAPDPMPKGWRVTSVRYVTGSDPTWHLGLITDKGKYVGIEESHRSRGDVVDQYLGSNAVRGRSALIGTHSWQAWSEPGGDSGLTYTSPVGTVFVGGSAGESAVRTFTDVLSFGSVKHAG